MAIAAPIAERPAQRDQRPAAAGAPAGAASCPMTPGAAAAASAKLSVRSSARRPGQRAESKPDRPGRVPVGRALQRASLDLAHRPKSCRSAGLLSSSCVSLHRFVRLPRGGSIPGDPGAWTDRGRSGRAAGRPVDRNGFVSGRRPCWRPNLEIVRRCRCRRPSPSARPLPSSASPEPPHQPRRAMLDAQKRSFLRMVSHELRTPLNSIIGFSEIISKELCGPLGSPQYREYADHIRLSGLKLLKLVNQVLEIARLEGRATDLDRVAEPLDHAVDDVLEGLRDEIAARRIRVIVADEGRLPAVLADPRGLRTVLTNLLQNAVTYSPEGGEVQARARRKGPGGVRIVIEDDGPGVDPDDLERLMRPFEQGENALTRQAEGAGLGLPIVALLAPGDGRRVPADHRARQGPARRGAAALGLSRGVAALRTRSALHRALEPRRGYPRPCRIAAALAELDAEFELLGDWEERYQLRDRPRTRPGAADRARAQRRQQGARLREPGLAGDRAAGRRDAEVPRRFRRPHRARPDRHPAAALFRPDAGRDPRPSTPRRRSTSWASPARSPPSAPTASSR